MTLICSRLKAANNRNEILGTATMPLPVSVQSAISSILEIPFTISPFSDPFFEIKVPESSGANVFLIRIGIFLSRTG